MKTQEEIEQLANEYTNGKSSSDVFKDAHKNDFIKGYTQCQEDVMELLESEIRRAYIHGQGNGQMMEAGLEQNEVEGYTNWRMRTLNKKNK
jgi:hypothetical protein